MEKEVKRPSFIYRVVPKRSFWPVMGVVMLQMAAYYIPKLLNIGREHYIIETVPDRIIPFVPVFVVFYVLAFLQWVVYYLILAREEKSVMKRYLIAGAVGKLVCLALFLIVPTTITRPDPGTGFFNFCCRVIYGFDEPTNLFPSMHCFESWMCMRLALEEKKKGRVPELSRSLVRGYSGEMILCVNRRQVRSFEGYITRVKRDEIEVLFEKVFSRRRWRLDEMVETAADEMAEATKDVGMIFVKTHTIRTCVLSILVFLSTVFIKQHYFVDMISAVLLAELALFFGKLVTGKDADGECPTDYKGRIPAPVKEPKNRNPVKTVLLVIGKILLWLFIIVLIIALYVVVKADVSCSNLERIDSRGVFYSLDYTGNYDTPLVSETLNIFGGGCSAFITENEEGEVITGRSYDFPHKDANGDPTGLNVLVKCSPEGKYKSVGIADIGLLSVVGLPYYAGAFDGNVSRIPLMFAPYLCMDGMNEKGLTVSILALDLKDGETPMHQTEEGKRTLMVNAVLRQLLDNCATLEEAVDLVEDVNISSTFGYDYHLFVTDAAGNSAVFEWRYSDFTVTYTDAVTNFYVGYDDACDCYSGDRLKDSFVVPENADREYRYGYGHGYGRFKMLAETLFEHISDAGTARTEMTDEDAMELLSDVSQEYDPEAMTSLTQYSVVYNSADLTATVCVMRDYDVRYVFGID